LSHFAPYRPYAPKYWIKNKTFACDDQGPTVNGNDNLARNHPVTAISEQKNFEARLANDGNEKTGWQPMDSTHDAWWQVDMETITTVNTVQITFVDEGNYHYAIDVSPDGTQWTRVDDQTRTSMTSNTRKDPCLKAEQMRYVRLTVLGRTDNHPNAVNEIKIYGPGGH
jgi:hypothetical protein